RTLPSGSRECLRSARRGVDVLRDAAEEQDDRDLLPPARDRNVRARALPAPGPRAVLVSPAAHGEARSRGAALARSMAIHVGLIGEGVCSRATARAAERVGATIAEAGAVLLCGGRTGVRGAGYRGAAARGGHL